MQPFNHNYFLGYVNEVNSQYVKIHYPYAKLMKKFHHEGLKYAGGNVGNFIVIEGDEYGFLGKIVSVELPDSERKSLSERAIDHDDTDFHPSGKAEILLTFSIFEPEKTQKTISRYPEIGAKVYTCSDKQISAYIKEFGKKENKPSIYAELGELTSNDALCYVSLDSLFGRHCAVVGTTGGGKSWTVSRLIESIEQNAENKIILIDATGEYAGLNCDNVILGEDYYYPYQNLTIPDLFFLLRPTGQSQRPVLLEAMRSLKIVKLMPKDGSIKLTLDNDTLVKANQLKEPYKQFYKTNIGKIENNYCDFDVVKLAQQIKNECVYQNGFNDMTKWGGEDNKTYDYQTSLISRIIDLINSKIFSSLFGFNQANIQGKSSVVEKIESFLGKETDKQILRISFEKTPSSFSAKEIVANALASYLLEKARNGDFKAKPVILFVDEAHQFLNKNLKDENFDTQTLEAFNLIAKECRKYGLFLCLATQMPRDIPIGTLGQMGAFIVHRLINEQDKKSIENACSSANKNALSFLPVLGEGEALLVGVDFPMPLTLKVMVPTRKPESSTPVFLAKEIK